MTHPTPLKFLMPGWFALVMGLCGLALAWLHAGAALGPPAKGVALVLGAGAVLVFAVLLLASLLRQRRYPQALAEDLRHPLRHAFVAALPLSLLLLVTLGVALFGPAPLWQPLWWLGSLGQLWATLWVLGRWLAPAPASGAGSATLWPTLTPLLLLAVVGNVLAPLAGLPLGQEVWSMAQFGIGILCWPLVLTLILARRIAHGPLPERALPTWFITLAPPAVIGLVLLQLQAPAPLVQAFWGLALFFLLWLLPLLRRIAAQDFGVSFWALSFPLAAFCALTLRLAELQAGADWHGMLQSTGLLLLAATSLVVLWLCAATLRGLRNGSLLAPEPLAPIVPASS